MRMCAFFSCDGAADYRHPLHKVCTFSAGESPRAALGMSGNDKLSVRLNTAIASNDAHSIDIKYDLKCWLNNVTNVLRKPVSANKSSCRLASEIAAKIEFVITMTEQTLREGKIATMSELQASFENILGANNVADLTYNRKALK